MLDSKSIEWHIMGFLRFQRSLRLEFLSVHRLFLDATEGCARGATIGGVSMSSFEPQAILTPYHFEIAQNRRGYWVAKDDEGLIGGVFRSRKDALRFALFEAAGESAHVRVLPADSAAVR
jgi:hypothetical protein